MVTESSVKNPNIARVSVVIPCYRCKETIRRALDSVYHQSLRPAEVILVDDASPDNTLDFLLELAKEYPLNWVKVITLALNSGPGTARNEGWGLASQPYVAFLDSDDSWHYKKIELQYEWMQRNPEVTLTGQKGVTIEDSSTIATAPYESGDVSFTRVLQHQLLLSNKFSTPSIMLRRDLPIRFPEGKRFCEDYELWCVLSCSGFECYSIDKPLTFCHKPLYGAAGLSGNLWGMEKGELGVYKVLRAQRKIGLYYYCFLKAWSLMRYLRRASKIKLSGSSE